ncbi:mannitol dehydrogenase [Mycolicibacterium litorale]|uniref:Mannitol-1-phosphate 5-dehydrogenase n=1 Tax=Mycolicibacterium litorale TaxID=758802 RepID=A0A6S6PBI8_9MYCO|nr:mannitol dehydrogenase family protein [Mycolicibacterium litorale]BCI54050.1 mannitol dehydrogenase [Mycolicibacterium litorale]
MTNIVRLHQNSGVPLSNATLPLHANALTLPTYDRSTLTPGIVHFGVGGFHRAHQAVYLDDLAANGVSSQWGVVGVGLHKPEMKEALSAQDCLYTVVERTAERETGRVIGSMCRYLYARDESERVIAALTDERTRIVSLTVTGDGYHLRPDTKEFADQAPEVVADLTSDGQFSTVWAYLAEALDRRRRNGSAPFTVMSCDNVADNGRAARTALVSFAALRYASLARWIEDNVAFPSTMVDRITPKTTSHDRYGIEQSFGVADRWPVVTESFRQWITEDVFCNGRPPLEEVGVDVVSDVAPHKLLKSRLLNGTHCALGYLGLLAGYHKSHQAMRDPLIYRYVEQLMREEVGPLVPAVEGLDTATYQTTILERLTNPRISDQLSRLAARGSTKMPSYLLPSLLEARAQGRPHALLTLALAAWLRYLRGYDFTGRPLRVEDPRAQQLTTIAKVAQNSPEPLLSKFDIFADLRGDRQFAERLGDVMCTLDRLGVKGALRRTLSGADMTTAAG